MKTYGKTQNKNILKIKGLEARPDEDIEDQNIDLHLNMYRTVNSCDLVDVYLDEPITELVYYRNMIHYLYNMQEHDVIRIWLDGPGGQLDTALAIISAMNESKGKVFCIVSGRAYSAHSMIALNAPHLILGENARFMLHTATYGSMGKQQEMEAKIESTSKQLEKIINDTYLGFLSEEEIEMMKIGKDYYFDGEELEQRVENRFKYLEQLDNPEREPEPEVKPKRQRKKTS